ncbi:MAG: site-specific integrase [Bacteroidaceae bacterium]|nr:site-specific integrase [Bacteroidaceae bacterium]
MRKCFKVSYYVRSNYENKQGKSPLMIRIFLNGEMMNIGTSGIYIDKKLWSNSTSRMKGRSIDALNVNAQLDLLSSTLLGIFKKYEDDEELSLEKIKSAYLGKNSSLDTVMDIFDKYLEDLKSLIGTSKTQATFNKYAVARKHFSSFLKYKYGRNDIMPKELTYIVIHDFDVYLKTVLQLKANSATKTLKFFKTVIIFAQKSGKMTHDPFMNFRFQAEKVDRGFLTDEEIQCMMKKTFDIPRLEQVRDIFIFSCFSGLAYIDMVNLTEDNIVVLDGKKWIIVNRHKTNVPSNILLLDIPLMIIDKYKGKDNDGRLLPIISNQKMNAYLKEIADVCGIKKRLTCHLARHTFATMTLSKGVPIETVSKMLGHTNIKTTQIYARITNKKIESDMMVLAAKLDKFNEIVNV